MEMERRNRQKAFVYPQNIFEKLEFDQVLSAVRENCNSPLGMQQLDAIKPVADKDQIETWLKQVTEFKLLLENNEAFPTVNYHELSAEIDRLKLNGAVLSTEELFRIYQFLKTVNQIFHFFEKRMELYPTLFKILAEYSFNKPLINAIKDIIDDDGKIRSNASTELQKIRKLSNAKYQEADRKFKTIVRQYANYGYLTDDRESVRAGRRVLSVLSEHKRKVPGLILDESATGRTTFIEPELVMQINNDLMELQQAEKREVYKILKNITLTIRPHISYLQLFQTLVGEFDFIYAKALFAAKQDAIAPEITTDKRVFLINAFHPVLMMINKSKRKPVIPLTIELTENERFMLISGPNAGGKSVALKTIGLMQIMVQCGFLIPVVDGSSTTIFRQLFVDIGDEQSLENDLSTYSSRLTNMKHFCQFADAKTLVLIDELGSGTDPSVGGPIGEAVIERLFSKQAFGVFTTHFSNLKIWAGKTEGVQNGAMRFDQQNLQPTYILTTGKPGSSYAFELAQKIGLHPKLIESSKQKMDQGILKFDELLNKMEAEKQQLAIREKELQHKQAKADRLIKDYEVKREKLLKNKQQIQEEYQQKATNNLNQLNKKFENLIKTWKEDKANKKVIRTFKEEVVGEKKKITTDVEQLKNQIHQASSKGKPTIEVGSKVKLLKGTEVGQVLEIREELAVVQFGLLKMKVKLNEIVLIENHQKQNVDNGFNQKMQIVKAASEFKHTIDIRGKRHEEAIMEVERFIDRALMYNTDQVKILHGKGTGVLRQSVRRILKNIRAVSSYKSELPEFGGDGITIVEFA